MAKRSVLARLCQDTPAHGFPDCYEAKKTSIRLVWLVILAGAFAAIGYYSYQMVSLYVSHPTVTKISEIRVLQMPFPNTTICSSSARFNASFIANSIDFPPTPAAPSGIDRDDLRKAFVEYFDGIAYQPGDADGSINDYLRSVYDYNFNVASNPNAKDILVFLSNATYDCRQLMTNCLFMLTPFDCCQPISSVLTDNGMCYHMKIPPRAGVNDTQATQIGSGSTLGLTLLTAVVPTDSRNNTQQSQNTLRVHLTEYAEPFDQNYVLVPPSMHALVRLRASKYIKDPGYFHCLTGSRPLTHHPEYTVGLCQNDCVYNQSMSVCGCAPAGYDAEVSSGSVCSPMQMTQCVLPMLNSLATGAQSNLSQCMDENCPQFCEYWTYELSMTYMGIIIPADFTGSMNKLSVFHGDMQYLQFEEEPLMNFETFICNLGGMFGFWSGASIIALVQCFYILVCGHCEDEISEEDLAKPERVAKVKPPPSIAGTSPVYKHY